MVSLYNLTELSFNEVSLKELAKNILKGENIKREGLDIILVEKEKIRELNRNYRGEDKETDVLSFSREETRDDFINPSKEKSLGEVVICPEAAEERGESLKEVLIHGALHLLGYDHKKKEEKEVMEKKAKKYL